MLLGRRRGRHVHRCRPRRRRASSTPPRRRRRPTTSRAGVMAAVRARARGAPARSPSDVEGFAHGMTVATNALLEGTVARTAFVATEGFTDVVELGRQARRELYRLCAAHPAPLDRRPSGASRARERTGPDGVLERAGRPRGARRRRRRRRARGGRRLPAAQLPPPRPRARDRRRAARAPRRPRLAVARGRRDVPRVRARRDDRGRRRPLPAARALPAPPARRRPRRRACRPRRSCSPAAAWPALDAAADHAALTVLSGPAGGAAAAALLAERCGEPDLLCFDMGGTSCDVCVVEGGRVRETTGREVGGRPLALPMVDIHTVGAGGGSIGWRDPGGALRVGPRSAGAEPGPACYGRGGTEPTVTDANLVLGHLERRRPAGRRRRRSTPTPRTRPSSAWPTSSASTSRACAEGIVRVANAEMVRALRVMTVERGIDPRALRAAGLRRRRAAARRGDRRGARDDEDPRPARLRRAQRARPRRRRPPRRRRSAPCSAATTTRASTRCATRSARRWAASRRSRSRGTCATAASRTS